MTRCSNTSSKITRWISVGSRKKWHVSLELKLGFILHTCAWLKWSCGFIVDDPVSNNCAADELAKRIDLSSLRLSRRTRVHVSSREKLRKLESSCHETGQQMPHWQTSTLASRGKIGWRATHATSEPPHRTQPDLSTDRSVCNIQSPNPCTDILRRGPMSTSHTLKLWYVNVFLYESGVPQTWSVKLSSGQWRFKHIYSCPVNGAVLGTYERRCKGRARLCPRTSINTKLS